MLTGNGAPTSSDGVIGQPGFIDTTGGRLYGTKTTDGWPTSYLQLALAGAAGTLPNDLTGNSLVLSPVSGDSNAVQLQVLNSAGNFVFTCDATGDTVVEGALTVAGQATLPNLSASNVVSSTQTVLSLQDVKGALQVEGQTTLANLQAQSASVAGALQAGALTASSVQTGSLNATGAVDASSMMATGAIVGSELAAENLTVGTAADINKGTSKAKFFGDTEVLGDSQLNTLEAAQLTVSGVTQLSGAVASGPLTAANLAVNLPQTGAVAYPIALNDPSGASLFCVDTSGNVTLKGTLQISGTEASGALETSALTAASIVNTGDTDLRGALKVAGASTLGAVTASTLEAKSGQFDGSLTATGATSLQSLTAMDVSTGTLEASKAVSFQGALIVGGGCALQAVTATDVQANSAEIAGSAAVGAGLSVAGASALQAISGTQATLQSLHTTGATQIDGTLGAGVATLTALNIQLPSSNAAANPMAVSDASGNSLLTFSNTGALTIAGQLIVNGGNASGAESLGALTVSSFLDQGNAEFQQNVKIDGTTAAQALTATALTGQSLNLSGNSVVGGTGSYTGALSSASLSTGAISSSSVSTFGLNVSTDQYGNGGKLTVAVQANLPTTYTADLHPSSVSTSGSESVGGNLSVTGSASLTSLSVSGATTLGSATTAALTAASLSVTNAASIGGALAVTGALTGATLTLQSSSSLPIQILDASGNVLLSQDGQGNLDIKGTLSVSGQPTGSANNLGAITVTSLVDSGSAQIQQALNVAGATTLAALTASGATTLGTTTTGQTTTGALSSSSASITAGLSVGTTLQVGGATSLAALTASSMQGSSLTTTGSIGVGTTLTASGPTTLQGLTAGQATIAGLQVSNNATIGGTLGTTGSATFGANASLTGNLSVGGTALISGATTVPSLSVSLPSSGASSTPITVKTSGGTSLLSFDSSGNLTIAGAINAAGGTTNGGAISATSITDSGTLSVSGATTLAALTATSLATTGAGTLGSLVVQLPSSGAAAKPINLLSSASTSLFSVDSSGNELVGGTLGVTGATSLTTLSTSQAATLNSASVTNALSAATLSTSGAATLSSLAVTNAASVGTTLGVGGAVSAARYAVTGPGSISNPILSYAAASSGNGPSGIYSESNFGQWYETVGNAVARSITFVNTNPNSSSATFYTHSFYSGVSGATNLAHRFYTGNGLAFSINGSSGAAFAAGLSVAGATTSAGVTLSSGALSFADGTSLTTATVANKASYATTGAGTAAAPAFAYASATNGAGLFFDAAPGNVYVSVNGFKSLYSTAASNAAAGANGWVISSTLGAGNNLLALYGSGSTTTPVAAIDGAGALSVATATILGATNTGALTSSALVKATGLTISASGGALTFGDGTTMTTAATASSSSGGSATSAAQLRYGTGAPTTSPANPATQNDGDSYIDQQQSMLWGPRASGTWPSTPISLIGPAGPAAAIFPNFLGCYQGPIAQLTAATALSTTPVVLTLPNSSTTSTYVPAAASYFLGGTFAVQAGTVTFEVYDQTAGVSIYKSASYGPSSIAAFGPFPVGSTALGGYPLTAGNTVVWRATGSGSAVCYVSPIYYDNVTGGPNSMGISTLGTGSVTAAQSTTYVACKMVGNASYVNYIRIGKPAYMYQATITNSGTSGYVTAYCCLLTSSSAISTVLCYATDVAGAVRQVQPGETFTTPPFGIAYLIPQGANYAWATAGTSNGPVTITYKVLQ